MTIGKPSADAEGFLFLLFCFYIGSLETVMKKDILLTIVTGLLAIALCYILIFEDTKNNKAFWGVLALFFIAVAIRTRINRKAGN